MIALTLARKPPADAVGRNASHHGTGALNIGACRIGFTSEADKWKPATSVKPIYKGYMDGSGQPYQAEHHKPTLLIAAPDARGRWPSNLILSGHAPQALDGQSGQLKSVERQPSGGTILNPATGWNRNSMVDTTVRGYSDSGGASRFFKVFGDPTTG
jgi:site-specific DNA-methyltransferase (adenine-specific)